ncbi:MAG TPA: SpoIID/LytB domain-containing protein [Gaiellaceae bacterium]|nr:SpoIID/LytB domain-containing protein [Gaiellaceae bacterium]
MVSTLAAALLAALGLSGPSATHAAPPSGATFFVSGHGWGHGVGLAQYGAYGYALHGWLADDIVAHYYPGTDLGQAPVKRVRVLLVPGSKRVVVSSRSPFSVRDAAGKTHKLAAGKQELGPGLKLKLAASAKALPGPLVFSPGSAPLALGDRGYRGTLRVTGGKAVRVVNTVGLEPYLWGVVPSEMPDTWPTEALKSQAIVARTYALTHMQGGGDFDVYPDTRSQVYGGMPAESDSARAAVNDTSGEVVLYKGELAQTFFFSSSGGRTANVQDVWGGSKATPYLVSVPDPYDTLSPYHDWGPLKISGQQLGNRLGSRGTLLDVRASAAADGRVRSLTLIGSKGDRTVSGSSARAALGLRSTWFTIGTLSLTQPADRTVEYGAQTHLTGLARGIPRVTLESRPYGGEWKTLAVLKSRGGTVTATLSPKVTTDYRISSGIARSAVVRLSVAPSVRLTASSDRTAVTGLVKPLLPGAAVQVQRQGNGGAWTTVSTANVTADGAFEASVDLTPGSYRARVVAGKGFAAGLSPVLTVVPA